MAKSRLATPVMGAFACSSVMLAKSGVATIPICPNGTKRPLIKGWAKWSDPKPGLTHQLAVKFPEANIGVLTGEISNLFVVDIDTRHPTSGKLNSVQLNELVAQMIDRFGDTEIIVGTPSGGVHLYYKSNNEKSGNLRHESLPVDYKGSGGFVLAPPSDSPGIGRYFFRKGGFAKIDSLRTINPGALKKRTCTHQGKVEALHRIPVGGRWFALRRELIRVAPNISTRPALLDYAASYAHSHLELDEANPVTQTEINRTSEWVWRLKINGSLWSSGSQRVSISVETLDRLQRYPGALQLFMELLKAHGADPGKAFAVSPRAMAQSEVVDGRKHAHWYRKWRDKLIELGMLTKLHNGGTKPGDPSIYNLALIEDGRQGATIAPNIINSSFGRRGIDTNR